MVVGLFDFRVKWLEPVLDRNAIVLIFDECLSERPYDARRTGFVSASQRAASRPLHRRPHPLVCLGHRLCRALLVMMFFRHFMLMRSLHVLLCS